MAAPSTIGTLNEGPLHAGFKEWYRRDGDHVEVQLDGYHVDLVRGELLIEIQTSGFAKIRRKLRDLLQRHPVRLVHPVVGQRWIVRSGPTGEVRRRSPKQAGFAELFRELVSFPELLAHERFVLEIWLVRAEEVRSSEVCGRRSRRRGFTVCERRLVEPYAHMDIAGPADLLGLLPDKLGDLFDTAQLAHALGISRELAQKAAYCLRRSGAVQVAGKRGNAVCYRRQGSLTPA